MDSTIKTQENIFFDVKDFFLENGYDIVNYDFVPEHRVDTIDEETGESYFYNEAPLFTITLDKRFKNSKQVDKLYHRLEDKIYMKHNGTILKIAK